MLSSRARSGAVWLLLVSMCPLLFAEAPELRIRLKDGSFSKGSLVPSDQSAVLGWQSEGFLTPFEFDLGAVRSLSTHQVQETEEPQEAELLFELRDGMQLAGRLRAIDAESIELDSPSLGTIRVARTHALALVSADYQGQLVYAGLMDDGRWTPISAHEDWSYQGGALVATRQGASILGNVELPPRSRIQIGLSWKGVPDFVLSLGTLANNKVSRIEEIPAAARLEVWDKQLALVRDVEGGADIALLSDLSAGVHRLDLAIYLDQEAGTVVVCDSHGRPLENIHVPAERVAVRPSVHLVNIGPSLTIEQFEVREWDGVTSTLTERGAQAVLTDGDETIDGSIEGFDPQTRELLIQTDTADAERIPLERLRRGDLARPTQAEEQPPAPEAAKDAAEEDQSAGDDVAGSAATEENPAEEGDSFERLFSDLDAGATEQAATQSPTRVEVIWADRSRLIGTWLPAEQDRLRLQAEGVGQVLSFPADSIRGIIGTGDRFPIDLSQQKNGTLKLGESQLAGALVDTLESKQSTGVFWRPHGSRVPAELAVDAAGAIVYRRPLPNALEETIDSPQPSRNPLIKLFLGGNRIEPSGRQASPPPDKQDNLGLELLFRTGDAIDGTVEKIDEQGVTFRSAQTETTFVPSELVQHIWLNPRTKGPEHSPEELERLMTVPRSMKNDPPTHLFISTTGDYLRGRLVRYEAGVVTVEVRLEVVDIPADRIAQIVWLHDRDWNTPAESGEGAAEQEEPSLGNAREESAFRLHLIAGGHRGLTLIPSEVKAGTIHGSSQLLGEVAMEVSRLDQVLFGRDIGEQVRAFQENPWMLSLAQYPQVFLDSEAGGPSAGVGSPLVGLLAPDFALQGLDGERFRLSENRDQVIVLDFWASWCGPCMQTMPQIEEVVADRADKPVKLVAVNIQETAARASAAVERLGLSAHVLLDVDGQIAAAYEATAIPQTVIIDPQGKITHIFIGGGSSFVSQFRDALDEVLQGSSE